MGFYINPRGETKEAFLKRVGKKVERINWNDIPSGSVPVVVSDNGSFKEVVVAYSERELTAFTLPQDMRPKTFYFVPIGEILSVVNDDRLKEKLEENGLM